MATSSIFTNFAITDKKTVEQLLDALDEVYEKQAWESTTSENPFLSDPEVIQKLVANAAKKKENK